jgi:hypothetical protein
MLNPKNQTTVSLLNPYPSFKEVPAEKKGYIKKENIFNRILPKPLNDVESCGFPP